MTTTTSIPAISYLFSFSATNSAPHNSAPNFPPFNFAPKLNPSLRISYKFNSAVLLKRHHGPCCCSSSNAEISPDFIDDDSSKVLNIRFVCKGCVVIYHEHNYDCCMESSINIQLPRRSLLVQFTCDACGERTRRLINRLAYERGTVFVQCAGCLQHHKLVDNLGLVVEYDFRDGTNED